MFAIDRQHAQFVFYKLITGFSGSCQVSMRVHGFPTRSHRLVLSFKIYCDDATFELSFDLSKRTFA